jgi:hypothetical protein
MANQITAQGYNHAGTSCIPKNVTTPRAVRECWPNQWFCGVWRREGDSNPLRRYPRLRCLRSHLPLARPLPQPNPTVLHGTRARVGVEKRFTTGKWQAGNVAKILNSTTTQTWLASRQATTKAA